MTLIPSSAIAGRLPGSHPTDLQRPWRPIRKRTGLEDVRIHDLRRPKASADPRHSDDNGERGRAHAVIRLPMHDMSMYRLNIDMSA